MKWKILAVVYFVLWLFALRSEGQWIKKYEDLHNKILDCNVGQVYTEDCLARPPDPEE